MKQLLLISLAFILTGCGALAPVSPTAAPTTTARIEVQTVIVTVLVTQPPTQTPIPTATLTPIPTFTVQPTSMTGTPGTTTPGTPGASDVTSPTATLPDNAGGGIFTDLTRSSDQFAISCQPDTITFGLTATDPNVAEVDLFYRMENQAGTSVSGWIDIGKMTSDQNGNFTMDFKSSLVDPGLRTRNAWFDYQFVGLSKAGAVLGRSAKITQQVKFMLDCSG
ncbi:MAG: hypothetical protein ACXWNQ_05655 [Anaerolineales bacterium]